VSLGAQTLDLPQILSRLSEEAEMFRRVAPQTLAEESLSQRSLKPPPRFRPRVGSGIYTPPPVEFLTREVLSEYSYSALKESPDKLYELRKVISVDGRPIRTVADARHALGMDLRSDVDRARKRMLEEFQKYGLQGAASDFGQLILLFTKRRVPNYTFRILGTGRVGADEAIVLGFEQREGDEGLLVFEGRKTVREKLSGQLWVRRSDGLPLRIAMRSGWTENRHVRRHDAIVEYAATAFGTLAPASVKHSEYFDNQLITENLFHYSPFKKFGADTEIKFDVLPEPPSK
jgi:hypothetical protein